MNNDANALANRLISAGFAVELLPGSYNLILSIDNLLENENWVTDLEPNTEGFVELPNGSVVEYDLYTRITDRISVSQISGTNNGFTHGVSLLSDNELADDLDFFRTHNLIHARIDLADGGLLIGSAALADAAYYESSPRQIAADYRDDKFTLDVFGFDAEETSYVVVTPNDGPIDVYDAPGQIVSAI